MHLQRAYGKSKTSCYDIRNDSLSQSHSRRCYRSIKFQKRQTQRQCTMEPQKSKYLSHHLCEQLKLLPDIPYVIYIISTVISINIDPNLRRVLFLILKTMLLSRVLNKHHHQVNAVSKRLIQVHNVLKFMLLHLRTFSVLTSFGVVNNLPFTTLHLRAHCIYLMNAAYLY